VVQLLLLGPVNSLGSQPRDAETTADMQRCWGVSGERAPLFWRANEMWLRAAAEGRGIRPSWPGGKFFAQALAETRRKGLR
jgi:hypothetical protein